MYVGVSCAGVFESTDGGNSWNVRNEGLIAAYLPNPRAELGHDPHKILLCKDHPEILWQQNHCGIFRSADRGLNWDDVSGETVPRYGFSLCIDEHNPMIAWVIPAVSDEERIPVDLRLAVYKTTDGGENWRRITKGLSDSDSFDLVLRHSFAKTGAILAFGTNNGNLYLSDDLGESWKTISHNLATVNCLVFA